MITFDIEPAELCKEMEAIASEVRKLIISQPPIQLLAYVWSLFHQSAFGEENNRDGIYSPSKESIQQFQLVLEYIHAAWSCSPDLVSDDSELVEADVARVFELLEKLKQIAINYCIISTPRSASTEGGLPNSIAFHAKSTWLLLRGNRYQPLEQEFYDYVLRPHNEALERAYGMSSSEIAMAIQRVTDRTRTGFSDAAEVIAQEMAKVQAIMDSTGQDMAEAMQTTYGNSPEESPASGAFEDLFFGGNCNLSKHTTFTPAILEDISFHAGENLEFFGEGEFCGTPFRTLPARLKPAIKLGEDYYVADGQFIRDASYRAIQRGLVQRLPDYRESWNANQKNLVEKAFTEIFSTQLAGAEIFHEVYYRDVDSNQWVETDLVVRLDDVLVIVEAKAGVMAMHSPATNLANHERAIRDLILKAYRQTKRFVRYLFSRDEVALFEKGASGYIEVGRVKSGDLRMVLPIGLTVESFSPFSSMVKEIPEITKLEGRFNFVSMSVDDLFILTKLLPTAGELFHYLEVRQAVAGIKDALLFDEIDHLGAYIENNRIDITINEQLEGANFLALDSFCDVVDQYFMMEDWREKAPPSQHYPTELALVLAVIDKQRPNHWLELDACLRNVSGECRDRFAAGLKATHERLGKHRSLRFLFSGYPPFLVWLTRDVKKPGRAELLHHAKVACIAAEAETIFVIRMLCGKRMEILRIACSKIPAPNTAEENYPSLREEAQNLESRAVEVLK